MRTIFLLTALSASAVAASITITDPEPVLRARSNDGGFAVTRTAPVALSSAAFNTALFQQKFADWTLSLGTAAPGRFEIDRYKAAFDGGRAGAEFSVDYQFSGGPSAGRVFQWVQFVDSDRPLGRDNPSIDPVVGDDGLPFFYSEAERQSLTGPDSFAFGDFSRRPLADVRTGDAVNWRANLFLVEWDGRKDIIVRDGIQWGWDLETAFRGFSEGVFDGPFPTCPPARCAGLGTNRFFWGQPIAGGANALVFDALPFSALPGEEFTLGRLNYFNGETFPGSEVQGVELRLNAKLDLFPQDDFSLNPFLSIISTPNSSDPDKSADRVGLPTFNNRGLFNVRENQQASADLRARFVSNSIQPAGGHNRPTYQLEIVGFANPSSGGFVGANPVPEPESWGFILLSFLGGLVRRKMKVCSSLSPSSSSR